MTKHILSICDGSTTAGIDSITNATELLMALQK